MPSSRRTFLKTTLAGASLAIEDLNALARSPNPGLDNTAPSRPGLPAVQKSPANYTRGIGVYPGDPQQYFGPTIEPGDRTYRNLALLRPAYHSSSYDYNLTAQLVTDGIKHIHLPNWVATSTSSDGPLPKNEREFALDHNPTSATPLRGARAWLQIELGGGEVLPEIDRIDLLVVAPGHSRAEELTFAISVSQNGRDWRTAGSVTGPAPVSVDGYPVGFATEGQLFKPSIPFNAPTQGRFYRVECSIGNGAPFEFGMTWQVGEVAFFNQGKRIEVGGPYHFSSAWMSASLGEEWVYADLGAHCEFDQVKLYWIAPATEGSLQVSDDAEHWKEIHSFSENAESIQDFHLRNGAKGRYVRVLMKRPSSPFGYILSEFEVYGRGGVVAKPKPSLPSQTGNRLDLAGGGWQLQRDSLVTADGEAISKLDFNSKNWVAATVPGTALVSYLNAGAIPDPNYGENQLQISDSFFYADFWYRTEFTAPSLGRGRRAWLNFDGINWKADVFLNGTKVGRIEGGFARGRFDVTEKLLPGRTNAIAVRVEKNATPGSVKQKTFATTGKNGGALGADNPTFHASIGWDWIPTIRGRNTGIWDNVYLTTTGPVTIENPSVSSALPLPDKTHAYVTIKVDLANHGANPLQGTLRGSFGETKFEQPVNLGALSKQTVEFNSATHPQLRLQDPNLWWPAGYGRPDLYDVELTFEDKRSETSDSRRFKAGIRQMTYSTKGGNLKIWINGRRFIAKGGNWGFSESMLRYGGREFDAAVRYHREMNFTMIRNWVGQAGGDEFYEACDRHGIMVWQDFWLANPWDGPNPDDDHMFLRNTRDLILRIRNHPSIGLYCGRNEGFPPPPLEKGITEAIKELHPGIQYIPSSADDTVSGHGPYSAMPRSFYFSHADTKLHSEMGMPNIPTMDSVRLIMPSNDLWPQGLAWGLHDFCLEGAQRGSSFRTTIEENYGGASSAEEWVTLAQFLNYDGYRAMFEAQSKYRMGLLLWMSHPCWPSFVWQTYDYYFDPSAAYFGCKKACEPLHIQWNPVTDDVEVVNDSAGKTGGLTAHAEILNMDGIKQWEKSATLDSSEDSVVAPFKLKFPSSLTPVHFIRLSLNSPSPAETNATHGDRRDTVQSRNFYLRGTEEENYRSIRTLPKASLQVSTHGINKHTEDGRKMLMTEVTNVSKHPALMIRVKAVREKSGDRILPAIFSDNYVALMPGESRSITTEIRETDARGEQARIVVEGFNLGKIREA